MDPRKAIKKEDVSVGSSTSKILTLTQAPVRLPPQAEESNEEEINEESLVSLENDKKIAALKRKFPKELKEYHKENRQEQLLFNWNFCCATICNCSLFRIFYTEKTKKVENSDLLEAKKRRNSVS
jgi:hypothetical protein